MDELEAGREREKTHRTAECPNDDSHGQIRWVDTAAACRCSYGGESSPPANEQTVKDKANNHWLKLLSAERCVKPDRHVAPYGVYRAVLGPFCFLSVQQPDAARGCS